MDYDNWAVTYEECVHELASSTWEDGIIRELRALGVTKGRIMDAGAGTGIGCRMMRTLGDFDITAVDRSPNMLAQLRNSADRVLLADLTELPDNLGPFDIIVSGFDTLNYLSSVALSRFLSGARALLAPSAMLIFDYSTPRLLRESWKDRTYAQTLSDGRELVWAHRWDGNGECSRTTLTLRRGDTVLWKEEHIQFAFDTYQLHQIAAAAGLRIRRMRNIDSPEFSPDADTHLLVLESRSSSEGDHQ